ncbi:glycogen-binding domain-containing protein [Syntrophobacter fumaroxidans]|uniref:Glycoside hydrolase, family 13 domain protein n=1 Tax=Syntrophobacter fumaroxidans (strain DSM 10017 / MPOB) TaxID=335543 RepID=A0LQ53_SYNFM|nr:glycogen-binding domain-containing protein [Syntrophobacter fumaroxidans]ABK19555.1 glycoside hydrolase, family 13 domain protein [Syntrophobacter fumaroxidans MPOB]
MVKDRGTVEPIVPDDGHDVRLRRESSDRGESVVEHPPAEDRVMQHLKEAIRRMPDIDPPDLLLESVMHSVRTGRLPLRTRIMRWAGSPRSITFTPLRVAPVAAVLVAVCLALAFHVFRNEKAPLAVRGDRVQVVLALRSPEARSVAVMGSFNGWRAEPCEPRTVDGETRWTVTLQLPSGRYEYAFVVDGKKIIPDPGAGLHEEDGFGNHNAVLLVGYGNGNSI